jgi:hypothetical protein
MGDGPMGLGALANPTRVAIITWRWGAYLGEEGLRKGIRAKVSSFSRAGVNSLMAKGKVVGHYVNSILAKREAMKAGYDEALMLDAQGYVTEASGENIFVVKNGKVFTPALGASILGGITRDTVMTILRVHEHRGRRAAHGPRRAVRGRRDLHVRHRSRGDPGPRARRPQDRHRRAGRDHQARAGPLLSGRAGTELPDPSWITVV